MLRIQKITFGYDGNKIIDNFSYQFETWKIYGLFWKSWLWKSTLARLIAWFLSPLAWAISLDNKNIFLPSKDVFYVNQKDDIFYRLTLYENLYILCHDAEKVTIIFKQVGLYDYMHKFPKELSWWMLKRLSFARVLLLHPKVLVLDEPFVHLDTSAKNDLLLLLSHVHNLNKDMIIILISHSVQEMKMMDKIILFKHRIDSLYEEKSK